MKIISHTFASFGTTKAKLIESIFQSFYKKYTLHLTYELPQVLPWNNDTATEKMDGCNWCRQITNDFFQYIHA